nr:hypothetical protein [Tanacetum cinerariifolium]
MLLSESTDSIFVDAEISVNSTLPAPRDITDMWYGHWAECAKIKCIVKIQVRRRGSGAILHMQRTDDMIRIEEENGNIHDFEDGVYVKRVDSENNKDSKSEDNPTFQEQATVKKKSKSLNKKVDKQRSSNDWSMGSLSDRSMADFVNSPKNQ